MLTERMLLWTQKTGWEQRNGPERGLDHDDGASYRSFSFSLDMGDLREEDEIVKIELLERNSPELKSYLTTRMPVSWI